MGLRVRLLATLAIAIVVALATVALVGRWATQRELERFVQTRQHELRAAAGQMLESREGRVLLADDAGRIVFDSAGEMVGREVADPEIQQLEFTREVAYIEQAQRSQPWQGSGVFVVRMVPPPETGGLPGEEVFLTSVNAALGVAVVVGGLAAALLALLFSRRVLGRIDALTTAAHSMERGDLRQRVDVGSPDEVGKLAHAFNAMAESLERNERLRRQLVTDVAHELRTPLSNLRGYLEALRDGVAKPSAGLIHSLHEEALLLARLVEDLHDLSLAEAGKLSLQLTAVDVGGLARHAVEAASGAAGERGIDLRFDASDDLPLAEVDSTRIGQVLRNLIANALTHTQPGGAVLVSVRDSHGAVEIVIRDTGAGIASEHLPHVFERFYRADPSRSRTTGGAGIGLAIVKELVEAHGGSVEIESTLGQGTLVAVRLPALQVLHRDEALSVA